MIYKTQINSPNNLHKFIKDTLKESVYIDIETSGFSPKNDSIISITLLIVEKNEVVIYQTFSNNTLDEISSLGLLVDKIKDLKYIITYNGNTFDINFLNTKLKSYNINFNIKNMISIDLYKDMQKLKKNIDIENLKLKTVEKYFDIHRKDTLTGKDIVELYTLYNQNPKDEYLELILNHNFEDVLYLPQIFNNILKLYPKTILSHTFGLVKYNYTNIKINKNWIKINLQTITDYKLNYLCEKNSYKLLFNNKDNTINIYIYNYEYNYSSNNKMLYTKTEDFSINSFKTLNKLKNNIIPLIINDKIIHENIIKIIEDILTF